MIRVLPYTCIIGQDSVKLALEIAAIAPRIGGVLIRGERGTGKSTAVRAFAAMMQKKLPVTLPINATEDRVVGGWKLEQLLSGVREWQEGLLQQADKGFLYIDEVNLLDDHLVNMLLDAASTGVLVIQRDGKDEQREVHFTLVGTMNPEEGDLRPQLLDRFGLEVEVKRADANATTPAAALQIRRAILDKVLRYEQDPDALIAEETAAVVAQEKQILEAQHLLHTTELPTHLCDLCVRLAQRYDCQGHRGDYVLALAARAAAALRIARTAQNQQAGTHLVNLDDIRAVTPLALQHRRPVDPDTRVRRPWDAKPLNEELKAYAG